MFSKGIVSKLFFLWRGHKLGIVARYLFKGDIFDWNTFSDSEYVQNERNNYQPFYYLILFTMKFGKQERMEPFL